VVAAVSGTVDVKLGGAVVGAFADKNLDDGKSASNH